MAYPDDAERLSRDPAKRPDRQIGSTKRGDRYVDCRIRTEFAFDCHFCYATGGREWSSGKSRMNGSRSKRRPLLDFLSFTRP